MAQSHRVAGKSEEKNVDEACMSGWLLTDSSVPHSPTFLKIPYFLVNSFAAAFSSLQPLHFRVLAGHVSGP